MKLADGSLPAVVQTEYANARDELSETGRGRRLGSDGSLYLLRKDHVELPVEIALSAVELGGPHVLCAVTDITERKKAMVRVEKIVNGVIDIVIHAALKAI